MDFSYITTFLLAIINQVLTLFCITGKYNETYITLQFQNRITIDKITQKCWKFDRKFLNAFFFQISIIENLVKMGTRNAFLLRNRL